jgi:hypothetical protein
MAEGSLRLPHCSGALGSGLAIFTRYPIISAAIHPYSLNGAPMDVLGGDWFVGKAASNVVILHPLLGQVQVFNTHVEYHPHFPSLPLIKICSSFTQKEAKTDQNTTEPTVLSTHGNSQSMLGKPLNWADMSLLYAVIYFD